MNATKYLTKQELFDKVVEHATKGERAISETTGDCVYRKNTEDGGCKKCFIGAVIPDKLYRADFEGRAADCVLRGLGLIKYNNDDCDDTKNIEALAKDLQTIHDENLVCEWYAMLMRIKLKYKLEVNEEHMVKIEAFS